MKTAWPAAVFTVSSLSVLSGLASNMVRVGARSTSCSHCMRHPPGISRVKHGAVGAKSTSCSHCLRYPPGISRVEGRDRVQGGVVIPVGLSEEAAAAAANDDAVVVFDLTAGRDDAC